MYKKHSFLITTSECFLQNLLSKPDKKNKKIFINRTYSCICYLQCKCHNISQEISMVSYSEVSYSKVSYSEVSYSEVSYLSRKPWLNGVTNFWVNFQTAGLLAGLRIYYEFLSCHLISKMLIMPFKVTSKFQKMAFLNAVLKNISL